MPTLCWWIQWCVMVIAPLGREVTATLGSFPQCAWLGDYLSDSRPRTPETAWLYPGNVSADALHISLFLYSWLCYYMWYWQLKVWIASTEKHCNSEAKKVRFVAFGLWWPVYSCNQQGNRERPLIWDGLKLSSGKFLLKCWNSELAGLASETMH